MSREATIQLNCIYEQNDIALILELLCSEGWTLHNENGNIEYLPIGDDDDFCWKEDNISYEKLIEIIETKKQRGELIGVHLFYKDTNHGIALLLRNIQDIIISIDINRKTIGKGRESLTDFQWYFSNLILTLNKDESLLICYKFEDYID